jgi:hypothetical protein
MNLDLYTEEYKNFRFLKSPPEHVEFFRENIALGNKIRPLTALNNENFVWKHKLTFMEQLLDLRNDAVYIVFPGILNSKNDFEIANVMEIVHPVILSRNPAIYDNPKELTIEDLPELESNEKALRTYVCSGNYANMLDTRIFSVESLPLVPLAVGNSFTALFYNKKTAESYGRAVTHYLRYMNDAVSSFTGLI